jgi:pyruvate formate lyase activating enzyme
MVKGYSGFSWTYTEPTIFYEYFYETAKLCKKKKLNAYQVWVSNGYTNAEPIKKASEYLHAVNIDYKGNEKTYRQLCLATLEPVQNAMIMHKKHGVWIEITNLLIPKYNDSDEQIKEMVQWILDNLGQVPLHFSRFYPMHKMLNAETTPEKTLERAAKTAEDMGIDYVYVGNIRHEKENTYCHNCKHLLIKRSGFSVAKMDLKKKGKDYHCPNCSAKIPLAGMEWHNLNEDRIPLT